MTLKAKLSLIISKKCSGLIEDPLLAFAASPVIPMQVKLKRTSLGSYWNNTQCLFLVVLLAPVAMAESSAHLRMVEVNGIRMRIAEEGSAEKRHNHRIPQVRNGRHLTGQLIIQK